MVMDTSILNRGIARKKTVPKFMGKIHPKKAFLEPTAHRHRPSFESVLYRSNNLSHNPDDFFQDFRLFLIFGKFIGLISIQGLFQKDFRLLKAGKSTFSSFLGLGITLALSVNVVIGFIAIKGSVSKRADQYAWSFSHLCYYGLGMFIFLYNYRNVRKLLELIFKWNKLQIYFTLPDKHLFRDISCVTGLIMSSAIGENIFVNLRHLPQGPADEKLMASLNITAAELYFSRANRRWSEIAGYHPLLNLYTFFADKLALYAWNYTDVMVALFARALYFKFQQLCLQGEAILLHGNGDLLKWRQLTRDFESLRELLDEVNSFLSPLIFANYGVNVYFLCLMFHNSVNPYNNKTSVASIYAYWAVAHLVTRVVLVSVSCARVNVYAHQLGELLRYCPEEAFFPEVQRMVNYLNAQVIGLSGLGCFTFTKPMIVKVAGVIFSFEVILLQALQLSLTKSSDCPSNYNSH